VTPERLGASPTAPGQLVFSRYTNCKMKTKVKLIKKEDRDSLAAPVDAEPSVDPKEWSTAVKSWVKEFQEDRRDGTTDAFDNLFGDSTP
jgi:hypothetical protein